MPKLEVKPAHKVSRAPADFEEFVRRCISFNLADPAVEERFIRHLRSERPKPFDND